MLTAKQHQTLTFIKNYIETAGYAPTEAEIAAGIGIKSRGVVHRYVSALAKAGHLNLIPHRRRNIELIEPKPDVIPSLPIIGRIAAGSPIEAVNTQESIDFSDSLLGDHRYMLEVKGDSMIGDNICDGDYIICEKCTSAGLGDIVVALVDNQEATLKRLEIQSNGSIMLIPSNPAHQPMVYPPHRITVQGRYIGLLRLQ